MKIGVRTNLNDLLKRLGKNSLSYCVFKAIIDSHKESEFEERFKSYVVDLNSLDDFCVEEVTEWIINDNHEDIANLSTRYVTESLSADTQVLDDIVKILTADVLDENFKS